MYRFSCTALTWVQDYVMRNGHPFWTPQSFVSTLKSNTVTGAGAPKSHLHNTYQVINHESTINQSLRIHARKERQNRYSVKYLLHFHWQKRHSCFQASWVVKCSALWGSEAVVTLSRLLRSVQVLIGICESEFGEVGDSGKSRLEGWNCPRA